MHVHVQDLLVILIVVPVAMETVKVMARVLFVLELALNLALLKMNVQLRVKGQDLRPREGEIEMMIETKKRTEIMKEKEAKVVRALLIDAVSPLQNHVQGLHVIVVDLDREVIRPGEDK